MLCARRTRRRAVATIAPAATMNTPTPSTAVPTISMSWRKFSMDDVVVGKHSVFQCCLRHPSRTTHATAYFSVWLRVISAEVMPRSAAKASAGPEKTRKGSPLSFLRMSMLRQPIALPIPVPNAFATASLPAKRAARCRSGNFMDIEYAISPSVKTRFRKRSPNRSMECWIREHSIRSTPIPITLIGRVRAPDTDALQTCVLARSFGIICHSGEHFFDRCFQANPHRARYDGVTNIEFGQIRNLVNERDVFVIDAVASVDLHMRF